MAHNVKKRSASHIYWGVDANTGELKHISSVPSGQKCGCICVACQKPFEARKGEKNRHHFAHVSNYECMYASEVAVYKALADAIEKECQISLPDVLLKFDSYRQPELLQAARKMAVENVHFDCQPLAYPPKLELTASGSKLRILIDFGHYYEEDDLLGFFKEAESGGYSILLYKMPKVDKEDYFTPSSLREIIQKSETSEWIYSRLTEHWRARYLTNAQIPIEHGSGYLCPISYGKYKGKYSARWIDCAHCNFNVGTPLGCRCLAEAGIQCKDDFGRPFNERMEDIKKLRLENEARLEHEEQLRRMRPVSYHTPVQPADGPSQSNLALAFERIKADFDPHSPDPVRDEYGRRWVMCNVCREIKLDTDMAWYGGPDGANQGACRECVRGKKT